MSDSIEALKRENQRLTALLELHGIDASDPALLAEKGEDSSAARQLNTDQKVALFRRLFLGRSDVYPVRWQNSRGDRAGYSPACANEWRTGVCEKPRIKCGDCLHRQLLPLTDQRIFDHLAGTRILGVYPLLTNNTCHFLAVDFDKSSWREDVQAFAGTCEQLNVPVAIEISRSGEGAHAWIFFDCAVLAREARQLGTALISYTCARTRQLDLSSYDRLFPNQDVLPKGGFGNLIALPLQKEARVRHAGVFVDAKLQQIDDQWAYLASIRRMSAHAIESTVMMASGEGDPLDVSFIDQEDLQQPWKRLKTSASQVSDEPPVRIKVTFSDRIYIEKAGVPQVVLNRLIRLAAFQNPEFYKAQAMRFSVWDKPRIICCADNYPFHIALPRGCLEPMQAWLADNGHNWQLTDERFPGRILQTRFRGTLHAEQHVAVDAILEHDIGILCAPTAFGKTVTAAAMIARRAVNTLVLVHRSELQTQWIERLQSFLDLDTGALGRIGGRKTRRSGSIDVATVQSLSRKGVVNAWVEDYGHVIVDECHHVGAQSFEAILKRVKARYITGLTATPIRRDGQQPILYMQCGPVRHTAARSSVSSLKMTVTPRFRDQHIDINPEAGIQAVFRQLAEDADRTCAIGTLTLEAYREGRNVLLMSERIEHLKQLLDVIAGDVRPYVLHGKMSHSERSSTLEQLQAMPQDQPRILLASGKLIGEGFDHSALDTLVLAMPVSWKGTLQQYVGRLHRVHHGKVSVQVIDIVDLGHPALVRMWERRQTGYRALGYDVEQV